MEGRSEVEAMAELAQQMWERYFKTKVIDDLLSHSLDGYKATVATNNLNGTLTVIRPFDSQTQTLKCPPALAKSAERGDQVLVVQLGDASNSFVLCGTDMSGFGDGGGAQYRPVSYDFSDIASDNVFTEVVENEEQDQVSTEYEVTRDSDGRIASVVNEDDGWETTVQWGTKQRLPASDVSFDNTGTPVQATTVQGAISELANGGGGGGGGSGAPEAIIATVEASSTASKNYAVKEYLILNKVLYRVTSPISAGDTITVGTNVTAAVLGDDVAAHIKNTSNPHQVTAAQATYDNTNSGLTAEDVQEAIDELASGGSASGKADQTTIAPVEASATATEAHPLGSIFYYNGVLYRALSDIAVGGTINTGTGGNATQTTVAQNFKRTVTLTSAQYAQLSAAEKAADIVYIITDEVVDYAEQSQLAYVESGSTATKSGGYEAGDYFCMGGTLYRVTTAISQGAPLTPNTNCTETNAGNLLKAFRSFTRNGSGTITVQLSGGVYFVVVKPLGAGTSNSFGVYICAYSVGVGEHSVNALVSTGSYQPTVSMSSSGVLTVTQNQNVFTEVTIFNGTAMRI